VIGQTAARSRILLALAGFLVVLGCLLVVGRIAEEIHEQEAIALDAVATPFLHGLASPAMDAFMRTATELGSTPVVATLLGLAVIGLLWKGRRREVAFLVVAIAGSVALNQSLKLVFQRPRPQLEWAQAPPEFSFPSGHAMNSLVFYLALALIVRIVWGRRAGLVAACVAAGLAVLVGVSRIYLGYHYLTDVVAGFLAGLLWLLVVASAFEVGPLVIRHLWPRRAGPSG
jgi:membrane-associated phospholipid phosphatase